MSWPLRNEYPKQERDDYPALFLSTPSRAKFASARGETEKDLTFLEKYGIIFIEKMREGIEKPLQRADRVTNGFQKMRKTYYTGRNNEILDFFRKM